MGESKPTGEGPAAQIGAAGHILSGIGAGITKINSAWGKASLAVKLLVAFVLLSVLGVPAFVVVWKTVEKKEPTIGTLINNTPTQTIDPVSSTVTIPQLPSQAERDHPDDAKPDGPRMVKDDAPARHGSHHRKKANSPGAMQTATASAPNGIAITGGEVTNPTVNNFAPPARILSDEERLILRRCLSRRPGNFSVTNVSNNSEGYAYARMLFDVLSGAGWNNSSEIPVMTGILVGERWNGIHISIHGKWDYSKNAGILDDGSLEAHAQDCFELARIRSTFVIDDKFEAGKLRVEVSERD
jgi:hypothetical protein